MNSVHDFMVAVRWSIDVPEKAVQTTDESGDQIKPRLQPQKGSSQPPMTSP